MSTKQNGTSDQLTVEEWLKIRKEAGKEIDPKTAEVIRIHTNMFDPYGVNPDADIYVGKDDWVCSPGSDIWVWFGDLPQKTQEMLHDRFESERAAALAAKFLKSFGTLPQKTKEMLYERFESERAAALAAEFVEGDSLEG